MVIILVARRQELRVFKIGLRFDLAIFVHLLRKGFLDLELVDLVGPVRC